jgi:hypothetical protein
MIAQHESSSPNIWAKPSWTEDGPTTLIQNVNLPSQI